MPACISKVRAGHTRHLSAASRAYLACCCHRAAYDAAQQQQPENAQWQNLLHQPGVLLLQDGGIDARKPSVMHALMLGLLLPLLLQSKSLLCCQLLCCHVIIAAVASSSCVGGWAGTVCMAVLLQTLLLLCTIRMCRAVLAIQGNSRCRNS